MSASDARYRNWFEHLFGPDEKQQTADWLHVFNEQTERDKILQLQKSIREPISKPQPNPVGHLEAERDQLRRDNRALCEEINRASAWAYQVGQQVIELQSELSNLRAAKDIVDSSASTRKSLRELIFFCHPDRNPNGLDSTLVTAKLNEIASRLK